MTDPVVVSGVVTDPTGRLVVGAVVAVAAAPVPVPDIAALTGGDGRFSIMVPGPGTYRLLVRGERSAREVSVVVEDTTELTVSLPE